MAPSPTTRSTSAFQTPQQTAYKPKKVKKYSLLGSILIQVFNSCRSLVFARFPKLFANSCTS